MCDRHGYSIEHVMSPGAGWRHRCQVHHFFTEKVLRQDNPCFKSLLLYMRDGTLDDYDVALLESRFKENLTDEELLKFKHALHLCLTWKIANNIVIKYLKDDMPTPIAKVRARMSSKKRKKLLHE